MTGSEPIDPATAAQELIADLGPLGELRSKAMFGGRGVFCDGTMFALVDRAGATYLRVDDATIADFDELGSTSHGRMPYWTIPPSVRIDDDLLETWARRSLDIARRAR